jgi:hypothetical protein
MFFLVDNMADKKATKRQTKQNYQVTLPIAYQKRYAPRQWCQKSIFGKPQV